MNITLSPELETMIREKVETGEYHDANDVISQAMQALAVHDAAIAQGIAEADRGETVELTDELWDQLMAEGDERAARGEPIDPLISGEF
jgi:putative addiction module CopG family antidote